MRTRLPSKQTTRARIRDLLCGQVTRTADLAARIAAMVTADALTTIDATTFGLFNDRAGTDVGSITAGLKVLTSPDNPWTAADVGKTIDVAGAGAAGGTLRTVIAAFVSAGEITLRDAAVTTVAATVTSAGGLAVWGYPPALTLKSATLRDVAGSTLYSLDPSTPGGAGRQIGTRAADVINVRDFLAMGDGVTDDTQAFLAAAAVANAGNRCVYIPGGNYLVTGTVTLAAHRIQVRGDGAHVTRITFNPPAEAACFRFQNANAADSIYQCGLEGIAFIGAGAFKKTAIDLVDTREWIGRDIVSTNWTGADSVGLRTRGREFTNLYDIRLFADIPIQISKNVNGTIDSDFFALRNGYLGNLVDGPSILIDTGCNVTNFMVDQCSSVLGKFFLYWNDTTSAQVGQSFKLRGIRREQSTDTDGYTVWIKHNAGLLSVVLEDVSADPAGNGFALSGLTRCSLINCEHQTVTKELLNVANVDMLSIRNCFWQAGGTATFTDMTQIRADIQGWNNAAVPANCDYTKDANAAHAGLVPPSEFGVRRYVIKQAVPAGAGSRWRIPVIRTGQYSSGRIALTTRTQGTGAVEGVVAAFTDTAIVSLGASANAGVGNVAGKVTLFWESDNVITIFNQLAATVDATVEVVFSG